MKSRERRLARVGAWGRVRTQLGGGVLFGALLPYGILVLINPKLVGLDLFSISLIASVLAVATGYYLFRSLVVFPGIRASYYILPTFSTVYGITVVTFFLLRLDYSRPLLAASYVLCVGWYYVVYSRIQRQRGLSVAVVPFGEIETIQAIPNITWLPLATPNGSGIRYDAIVADFHADMPAEWGRFLADAAIDGFAVYHVKQLHDSLTGRVEIQHLSENAGGMLTPDTAYQKVKTLIDLISALMLIIPVGIILAALAVLIKLDSPGPVFFRQRRMGFRGRQFLMWKLRTMKPPIASSTGDDREHAMTQTDDQRITGIGRTLRRLRLDELPQIINVIAGDMSWIGPRPEAIVLSQWYEKEIPFYRYRHIVRPGITGWAQVNLGHVSQLQDVTGKLHYDFYYIANFSFWIDALIAIRTMRTMATGFGSK